MKDLQAQLQKIVGFFRRYAVIICFIIFGAMYGYLIYASGQQAASQPSETEINEKFTGAKRPKVDESAAQALEKLRDQNVEIQSLFNEARNNPFSE